MGFASAQPILRRTPQNELPVPNVSESTRRIPAAAIRAFMIDAFCACGLPEADAGIVAEAMLDADLSGSDAHGIFRLTGYVGLIKRGQINPRAFSTTCEGALP